MSLGAYWNLRVDRHGQVFVITMQKPPENRINTRFAQEMIRALRDIEKELGPDSEGCVITRGSDEKFWCTGLDLDEADTNPFANVDGFFPVRIDLFNNRPSSSFFPSTHFTYTHIHVYISKIC